MELREKQRIEKEEHTRERKKKKRKRVRERGWVLVVKRLGML